MHASLAFHLAATTTQIVGTFEVIVSWRIFRKTGQSALAGGQVLGVQGALIPQVERVALMRVRALFLAPWVLGA